MLALQHPPSINPPTVVRFGPNDSPHTLGGLADGVEGEVIVLRDLEHLLLREGTRGWGGGACDTGIRVLGSKGTHFRISTPAGSRASPSGSSKVCTGMGLPS